MSEPELSAEDRDRADDAASRWAAAHDDDRPDGYDQDELYRYFTSRAFASGSTPRPSLQVEKPQTNPAPVQIPAVRSARHSPVSTRPLIVPEYPRQAQTTPTQKESSQLLRSITARDGAILQALHDYRYLNTAQLRDLFFPSLRTAQIRVQQLRLLGLIYRWKIVESPGMTRRHSLLFISARGARILSGIHADRPATYVERSRQARAYHWRAPHDLAANDLFVWLAVVSRHLPDHGLLLWVGEEKMRALNFEAAANRRDKSVPCPDGHADFLAPTFRVAFDLEWDRATEPMTRLRQKARGYLEHYERYSNAETCNVLFVVPTRLRERRLRETLVAARDAHSGRDCAFWITTEERLRGSGPLGPIWCKGGRTDEEEEARKQNWSAPLSADPAGILRLGLLELPSRSRLPEHEATACIGKPNWWERRPAGGEDL